MNKKIYIYLLLIGSMVINSAFGQEYKYKRSLEGIVNAWHQINIPDDIYAKINTDFSDVRIMGITENGDTIEAPYVLKELADVYDIKEIDFTLINKVSKSKGYYYTFKLPKKASVNSINLSFNKKNFDWLVTLEGSQNQQEWFTIVDKSRIVGIDNLNTSYQYTTLHFNEVNYKYLRLKVPSSKNPRFSKAVMEERRLTKGVYNTPIISSFKVNGRDSKNETEVLISLSKTTPISFLEIKPSDSIDYYRSIKVEYSIDSIKNTTGWHYLYKHLFKATLSSVNSEYHFPNQVLNHLRIIVDNKDNEPLNYTDVGLHGNPHKLIARFTKPAHYYLVYGNKRANVPNYDIARFQDNIPTNSTFVKVGQEIAIKELPEKAEEPLFKDSIWLWSIMFLVIFILAWFSYKMLKE